jgi:RNA polymerase sigma-70 factor (ECF subfamily)
VNLSLDWIRSSRAEHSAPASLDRTRKDGELRFELPDADPRIQADLAQEVQHVLAQLPASYRTILVLRDLEGFPTSEVAAIVGRQEATIRWRLAKAREKFREIWQRRLDGSNREAMDG